MNEAPSARGLSDPKAKTCQRAARLRPPHPAGRARTRQKVHLLPCDPQWRSFFSDGGTLDLCPDRETMARRLDAFAH